MSPNSAPSTAPAEQRDRATESRQTAEPQPNGDPTLPLWELGAYAERPGLPTTMPRTRRRSWQTSAVSLASPAANRSDAHGTVEPEEGQSEASSRFAVLQKWEGTVLDTARDSFSARLIDLTGAAPDHVATIRKQEVSPRDAERIRPDAIFYWYVGFRDSLTGERERASKFYFRRLPPVTDAERARARRTAARLRSSLGW